MVEMPPIPEELARWLLLHEAGADAGPDELAAAGEQVHLRLRAGLIVFLGQTGFDSLWARAMHLAQRTSVSIASTESEGPTSLARGWRAGVSGRNAGEALDVLTIPFASFITLLFSFVGVTLGVRLIQQVWPDLPSFESRAQTGDVTP